MSLKEALNHDNINVHPGTVNFRDSLITDIHFSCGRQAGWGKA